MRLAIGLVVLVLAFRRSHGQDFPFRNTTLPFEERIKDLVDRLTLNEIMLTMAYGGGNGSAPAIPRLGIKPYMWDTECLTGGTHCGPATSFPQSIGMAASFNYDMLNKVSRAISDEVRAKNNNYTAHGIYSYHTGLGCWSPTVNILRDPRWGRNQLSERDWRMTFLPQFKACVKAGSWSLMCSVNSINGVPACANKELLNDILRNEWGFKGYVVSDDGALGDNEKLILTDLVMLQRVC